jgi:hypothetical protein
VNNPNHQVTWLPTRPDFSIRTLRGTSTSRGYHETDYEVVSRVKLDLEDFARLDACGLLGIGQAWHLIDTTEIEDEVHPVVVDKRTGKTVDEPPIGYNGRLYTATHTYEYWRYEVRRICDSGD